jgi:DNA-binding CsgD family transcriptional regulator
MSYHDIATFLNISVNTVEGQMAIALKKLRSILKPYYLKLLFIA